MKTTSHTSSTKLGTGRVFGSMVLAMAAALSFTVPNLAVAQEKPRDSFEIPTVPPEVSNTFVPDSSVEHPEDIGVRAHTNYVLFTTDGGKPAPMRSPAIPPPSSNPQTQASLGCVYKVGPVYSLSCLPANGGTNHPTGGWGAIALVAAYDNPYAATDIAYFSSYWGLPAANFTKVLATHNGCTVSSGNFGWALEEALDIEWSHAMAPNAKIILVEACSSSIVDLMYAEELAGSLVAAQGGGDISNSWGGSEWSTESSYDPDFYLYWNQIAYFAAAGDVGGKVNYPSVSPWVVSAGGTTLIDGSGLPSESCWSGSGGGPSLYENMQGSQAAVSTGKRWTPDLAFDADPNSGVYVYDAYNGGWYVVGGTSVASPSLAGIVNNAGNRLGQGLPYTVPYVNQEDLLLYSSLGATTVFNTSFYDVTTGSNGYAAGAGYDFCTGIGTPRGLLNK